MWRTKINLKLQILAYSISFAAGLFITILLALFAHKKRLKSIKTFPNKEGSNQIVSHEAIETAEIADSQCSDKGIEKLSNESLNKIISVEKDASCLNSNEHETASNLSVKNENDRVKSAESKCSIKSDELSDDWNQYEINFRKQSVLNNRIDLSNVEAKYLKFSKGRRPSFSNYLQKSKKSFIGYDPALIERRNGRIANRSDNSLSWYLNEYQTSSRLSMEPPNIKRLSISQKNKY